MVSKKSFFNSKKKFKNFKIKNYDAKIFVNRKAISNKPKCVILTDLSENEPSLKNMIKQFNSLLRFKTETINLRTIDVKGGCLGCCQCTYISFYLGHCPVLSKKQFGFLISGRLSNCPELNTDIKARTEISSSNLTGIVSDESENEEFITKKNCRIM